MRPLTDFTKYSGQTGKKRIVKNNKKAAQLSGFS